MSSNWLSTVRTLSFASAAWRSVVEVHAELMAN